jgi:hypothetical protein
VLPWEVDELAYSDSDRSGLVVQEADVEVWTGDDGEQRAGSGGERRHVPVRGARDRLLEVATSGRARDLLPEPELSSRHRGERLRFGVSAQQ